MSDDVDFSAMPFIDYMNGVDGWLEEHGHPTSTEEELETVSASQEAGDTPETCAQELVKQRQVVPA